MTKHVHADLMMQYAKDAMNTETPWELWERYNPKMDKWEPLIKEPYWSPTHQYRHAQLPITINGRRVPAPCKDPLKHGEIYYITSLAGVPNVFCWYNSPSDFGFLNKGIVHRTQQAAIEHRDALLSFTRFP